MHLLTFFECSLPSTFCDLSPLSTFAHTSFTFIYFKNYPLTTYDVSRTQKWMEWAPPNHYGASDLDSKIHDQMSMEVLCGYKLGKWYTYVYVHVYVHPCIPRKTQLLLYAQHDHGIWSHHLMASRWGNSGNSVRLYFLGAPKSLQMVIATMKLKDAYSLEEKLWPA